MIIFRSAKEIADHLGITGTFLKRVRNGDQKLNKKHHPRLVDFYRSKLEELKRMIKILEK